jgi:beta-1,4-mannosyl-glycoprotein beta-1,4-N-acetylglucosaminyltransferase
MLYDCFTYFNEDLILDIRFNILYDKVDYFVIIEGNRTHSGRLKKKNFNINKFSKFKNKIKYFFIKDMPEKFTPWELENFQRNQILIGLKGAQKNDLVLISDCDEIPNLESINNIQYMNNDIFVFEQKFFYYKLNLLNTESNPWYGTKLFRYNFFKKFTPQEIRNYKAKQYPFWRIDKPKNLKIINKGGWHFSFLNSVKNIKLKIQSYAHTEFNINSFTNEKVLKNKIDNYQDLFKENTYLKRVKLDNSYPEYIIKNKENFKKWIA